MIEDTLGLEYFYVDEKEVLIVKITPKVLGGNRWAHIVNFKLQQLKVKEIENYISNQIPMAHTERLMTKDKIKCRNIMKTNDINI